MSHIRKSKKFRYNSLTLAIAIGWSSGCHIAFAQYEIGETIIDLGEHVVLPNDEQRRIGHEWVRVGVDGYGALTATGVGGVNSLQAILGQEAGSEGVVELSDGARWDATIPLWLFGRARETTTNQISLVDAKSWERPFTSAGELVVGYRGKGSFSLRDRGELWANILTLGRDSGSEGTLLVTGAGTSAKIMEDTDFYRGQLAIGIRGRGVVAVTDGGYIEVVGQIFVAFGEGGEGLLQVTDAGSKVVAIDGINVGRAGDGSMLIEKGGVVETHQTDYVGFKNGAHGDVTITGQDSVWDSSYLYLGYEGTGVLTLADNGTLKTWGVVIGHAPGASGTLNIGAAADEAAAVAGQLLEVDFIEIGRGSISATLNFNHTSDNYVLAAKLRGKGTINQLAGTTHLTGDGSAFFGTTNINGGELRVDGSLGGTLFVRSGGRLSGIGTVGSTTVGSGATIAPGNSIGTLNVNGDIRFETGSIYEVEANPQGPDSDLIKATGTATLAGGSVLHVGPDGNFKPGVIYTILSADGGVSGRFDNVSSNFAFLDPRLNYDAKHVYLGLIRNKIEFADYARTRNQWTVANGISSAAAGHAVYDAVALLPENGELVRAVYDNLSGEIHASAKAALLDDSRFVREAALSRAMAEGEGEAWVSAHGSRGRLDGDRNASRMDRRAHGLLIGADRALPDSWRVGLVAGYGRNELDVDDRGSSATVDGYTLGAYAGMRVDGLGVRFGAAYGWNEVDSTRRIDIPGLSETAKAKYDINTMQAFAEVGYRIERGSASIEPFLGLAYVKVENDPYRENGQAGLHGERERQDTALATLGMRADKTFALGSATGRLHGALGWRHAAEEIATARHAFSAGEAFTVAGAPLARNAAVVELGLGIQASERVTLGLDYSGQLASDARDHGLEARLEMRF
ncbi:autotransporter outer membrane beta-barrel domain-containing protein [Luteimonas aquatica]|uniref:autotransporter outer membrane beta-barrel domain-containing protein n=1 Tax=Luteimonas aquatica TaxID=450364 RepID=UPI001F5AA471|nr:autotransporter domain-containing protein [Luteimonas aquatica]